jgi:ABC-type nickel/cobalt efflux system permease component RcnA
VTSVLEVVSYGLLSLLGVGLVFRGGRELFKTIKPHQHGHNHHTHHHHDGECCGHAHHPDPKAVMQQKNLLPMLTMIVSIGIRPCTGAVLLLFLACIMGVVWSGIFAIFTMALGTALTTSLLAIITVKSKNAALGFMKSSQTKIHIAHALLSIIGGLVVITMCGLFMSVSAGPLLVKPEQHALPLMHLPNSK